MVKILKTFLALPLPLSLPAENKMEISDVMFGLFFVASAVWVAQVV
jgi:hypothetical protein